jgi:hypothetical protein
VLADRGGDAVSRALIIGSGPTVANDIARFHADGYSSSPHVVIAVNEIAIHLKRLDHWATLHGEKLSRWIDRRRATLGLDSSLVSLWAADTGMPAPAGTRVLPYDWGGMGSGSSGLFAVRVAFRLRAGIICLAGVPMTPDGHWNDPTPWKDHGGAVAAWIAAEPQLRGRVRSLSGWTREFLGEPTLAEWRSALRAGHAVDQS